MLTDEDIQKLMSVMATKQDLLELRDDISELKEQMTRLADSIDGLAKAISDLQVENAAIASHIDRHERWIKQIADKVGVRLDS